MVTILTPLKKGSFLLPQVIYNGFLFVTMDVINSYKICINIRKDNIDSTFKKRYTKHIVLYIITSKKKYKHKKL